MWRATAMRLIAALAGALATSACEPHVTTPQDASQRVRDSYAWMADAELCPTDVMRVDMRVNGLKAMSCADAELPLCFRRCRHGDTDSCYWLANTLEHADPEDGAAQALYQRACTLGEPSGCTNRAARMYLGKRRDPGVLKCAARTFERTCQLHDAWGCAMYGYALHDGLGVAQDDARALEALTAACRNLDASAPACGAAQTLTGVIRQSKAAPSSGAGGP
jgi:TPR repeat protein